MKETMARFFMRILGLCEHDWNLYIAKSNREIVKKCEKCNKIIWTGI